MEELWKPCVGRPGYEVSSTGQVRSYWRKVGIGRGTKAIVDMMRTPKLLKARTDNGYLCLKLRSRGKQRSVFVHRLVLEAFVGLCPPGQECRHMNDNRSDNRWPENLCWGSHSATVKDMFRNGGRNHRGENHPQAKLTEDQVREIKKKLANGELVGRIARDFKVSQPTISMIKAGINWSHVTLEVLS